MIPRKLAEIFFAQLWILLIPVVLIPALIAVSLRNEPVYEARATVWVGSTPIGASVFGDGSPYNTRAQNAAQVVNDLLATSNFRANVATAAGLVDTDASDGDRLRAGANMTVWAGTIGINVVTIGARAGSGSEAAAIVSGVIDEYLRRATAEAERRADLSDEFYQQQLAVATAELASRQAALEAYIVEHPEVMRAGAPTSLALDYQVLLDRVQDQQKLVEGLNASVQATQRELASAPQSQAVAFAVQDLPEVPGEPLPTSISSQVGLPLAGLVLGVLIAGTYFVIRYRTDHSIRSVEDLSGVPVPLLGAISELHPDGPLWWANPAAVFRRRHWRSFAQRTATSIAIVDGASHAP
jgi:hypothetical protein